MLKKLLVVLAIFISCAPLLAGSGKAIVTRWFAADWDSKSTNLQISNITGNDLEVTVTFYKQDGTLHTGSDILFANFQASNAELGAGKTGYITIKNSAAQPDLKYGYAVIEWKNKGSDDDVLGLVAHSYSNQNQSGRAGWYSTSINGDMPF